MLAIYPVQIRFEPPRTDPLFVGNYFNLHRMRWRKRRQRQQLIFAIAIAWKNLVARQTKAPGLLREEIFLTHLTAQVFDAKVVLEKFFKIERIGFSLKDGTRSPTVISPRKLPPQFIQSIDRIQSLIQFDPGPEPTSKSLTTTIVKPRCINQAKIISALEKTGRYDLVAPVIWLLQQNEEIIFYYRPAGRLQARDTSVWPIKAIETWPGWLREELFGKTVDIENAFCQFLVQHLIKKYNDNLGLLELKYPHLLRADRDRKKFREQLCTDVLKLPATPENISFVKRLIMSLANGSNCSAQLLLSSNTRSQAARIVREANPNLSIEELIYAGEKLHAIAQQFRSAKKALCVYLLKEKPTHSAMRKIFKLYFAWEREARYKIWEIVGRTGLHLHDGLDGIISDMNDEELIYHIARKTSVRVSIDTPNEIVT